MSQDPADVPTSEVQELAVAPLVEEQRLAVLPQRVVGVHAGAVVAEDRLGHECGRLAVAPGLVLDDVLELHHVITRCEQRAEAIVDVLLSGSADLVMRPFDLQAGGETGADHAIADISHLIVG